MSRRKALIIGSKGQDGRYLSAYLDSLGYAIDQIGRGYAEIGGNWRSCAITSPSDMLLSVTESMPDEIYFLAAHHHSSEFKCADILAELHAAIEINTLSIANVLEAVRVRCPCARLFYASSSRVFGRPLVSPQNESVPHLPICTYGISKESGMGVVRHYREAHGLFAASGILYHHESPFRPTSFLSMKVVTAAVRAADGRLSERMRLHGRLDTIIDWSHAQDSVRAMHAILGMDTPKDIVIASGNGRSVKELLDCAFSAVGLNWEDWVEAKTSPDITAEVPLVGDSGALRRATGWRNEIGFETMIWEMVSKVRDESSIQ